MWTMWITLAGCSGGGSEDPTDAIGPTDGIDTEDTDPVDTDDTEPPAPTGHTGLTPTGDTGTPPAVGIAVLGAGTHDIHNVVVTDIVTTDLDWPRDLEFHPSADELWVVNRRSDSCTIVSDPHGTPQAQFIQANDGTGNHFLAQPSALAFNGLGAFATSHEEHERTQGPFGTPPDFMGPTLWTDISAGFNAGHASHLDMLHNSPDGAGIAWEADNVFWVFDGWHDSLTRYDFAADHGLGGSDHTDGIIRRYVEGEVSFVPDVVSHMAYDASSGLLYVADSGNNRIAVLDTATGTVGNPVLPNYDGADQRAATGAVLTTLVEGSTIGMTTPAGLELVDGVLWVTDATDASIWAIDLAGNVLDYLETGWGPGVLAGLALDADGDIWLVDQANDKIVEITAP